jgi:tetratricopeptide (TPR) repeat protein
MVCLYLSGIVVAHLVDSRLDHDYIIFLKIVLAWGIPSFALGVVLGFLPVERRIQMGVLCAAVAVTVYLFLCVIGVYSASVVVEFIFNLPNVLARLAAPIISLASLPPMGTVVGSMIRSRLKRGQNLRHAALQPITAGEYCRSLFQGGERTFSLLVILILLFSIAFGYIARRHYYQIAIGYENEEQYDEALVAYQFYMKIWSFDDQAHADLASLFRKMGRELEAVSEWRQAKALNPDNYSARSDLYHYFLAQRKYAEAITEAEKLFELTPGSHAEELADVYQRIARESEARQDFEGAIAALRRAVGIGHGTYATRDAWVRESIAFNLKRLGRFNEQVAELRQVVELKPNDGDAWINLGTAYVNNRNFPEAFNAFERADRIAAKWASMNYGTDVPPMFPPGYQFSQIARIYSATNEPGKALENLERAIKAGCDCLDEIAKENDFEPIRNTPEYRKLFAQIK